MVSLADCLLHCFSGSFWQLSYFLDQMLRLQFLALLVLVSLLFNGSVYFLISSTYSPSVLLSAVEMSHTSQTALALARWLSLEIIRSGMHVLHILVAATILGRHLFCSELLIVWLLVEGGIYTKKYGKQIKVKECLHQRVCRYKCNLCSQKANEWYNKILVTT